MEEGLQEKEDQLTVQSGHDGGAVKGRGGEGGSDVLSHL